MKNIFAKIGPLFGMVGKIVMPILLMTMVGIIGFAAYSVFAPDEWPKLVCLSFTDGNGTVYSRGCGAGGPATTGGETAAANSHGSETTAAESPQTVTVPHEDPEVVVIAEPGQGLTVETGTKIVNLADPGGRRFLKATIVIEVAPPLAVLEAQQSAAESAAAGTGGGEGEGGGAVAEDPAITAFNEEMTQRMPIINDTLTTVLSSKTYEEIYTSAGKTTLKEEIIVSLNEILPELHVIAVYFTEFVVQ